MNQNPTGAATAVHEEMTALHEAVKRAESLFSDACDVLQRTFTQATADHATAREAALEEVTRVFAEAVTEIERAYNEAVTGPAGEFAVGVCKAREPLRLARKAERDFHAAEARGRGKPRSALTVVHGDDVETDARASLANAPLSHFQASVAAGYAHARELYGRADERVVSGLQREVAESSAIARAYYEKFGRNAV